MRDVEGLISVDFRVEKNPETGAYRVLMVLGDQTLFLDPDTIKKLDAAIRRVEEEGYTWTG